MSEKVPNLAADLAYDQAAAAWLLAQGGESSTIVELVPAVSGIPDTRLPLGALVVFPNGVQGVVTGFSVLSRQRYEIAWFDRHFWRVNRKCFDRAQFVMYTGAAENAAAWLAQQAPALSA